jgi:hypothetical protein
MSQYYTRPSRPYHAASSPSLTTAEQLAPLTESIYIFPNPSSDPPSSPAGSSVLSVPTDHGSYHSTTPRRDRSAARSEESYVHLGSAERRYASTPDSAEVELWEWNTEPEEDTTSEGFEPLESYQTATGTRWGILTMPLRPARLQDHHVRSRTHSQTSSVPTYRSLGDDSVDLRANSPHPPVHLPLLGLIASLFSVDEDTLRLLTHSTAHRGSVLFPGHDVGGAVLEVEGGDKGVHGLQRLLTSTDGSLESWRSLKKGFAVVYSTSPVPTMGISKLWGFVNQVWASGERAFKGVLVRTGD